MMYFCMNMSAIMSWLWLGVTAYDMTILQDFSPPRIGSALGNYFPVIDHNKPVYIEESSASRRHAVVSFCCRSQHLPFSNLKVMYIVNYDFENIWCDCNLWTFEFIFWELQKMRPNNGTTDIFSGRLSDLPHIESELSKSDIRNLTSEWEPNKQHFKDLPVVLGRCIYLLRCWFRYSSFSKNRLLSLWVVWELFSICG